MCVLVRACVCVRESPLASVRAREQVKHVCVRGALASHAAVFIKLEKVGHDGEEKRGRGKEGEGERRWRE